MSVNKKFNKSQETEKLFSDIASLMMELTWHGPKNGPGEAAGRSVPPSVPQLNFLQNMGWTRRQSSCSQKPGTVAVTHLVASLGVKSPLFHLRRCSFNH